MTASLAGPTSDDLVAVGIVSKAHGIKGEIKVRPYFGSPADFPNYKEIVFLDPDSGEQHSAKVILCRPQASDVILKLDDLEDRTTADEYRGLEILVDRNLLPPLPEDEYYWHDLAGLQVATDSGRRLGKVETFFQTGGHDVMVVRGGGHEYLIPLEKEFILKKDDEAGILTVKDVPGLFEIND